MALTAFPNGVSSFGIPVIGAGPAITTGSVWFVCSVTGVDSTGRGTDPARPFATIDFAIGQCGSAKGDIVFVMPGHVEAIIAAGGLAIDVAGVSVIGIGSGAARPSITFGTATTATLTISAAGCRLVNFAITNNIDALVSAVVVSAADVVLRNLDFREGSAGVQAALCVLTTAAADRLLIDGFRYLGDAATAGAVSAIALVGGDAIEIMNFNIQANMSGAGIDVRTTATTRLWIHDGYI